jgi:hypothetical protein
VIAVNLWTLLAWAVAGMVVLAGILIMGGVLDGSEDYGGLDTLVPPEIWDQLSVAAKASLRVVGRSEPTTRARFKKMLLRLAEGYVEEQRSVIALEAYRSALLELLGKYTL